MGQDAIWLHDRRGDRSLSSEGTVINRMGAASLPSVLAQRPIRALSAWVDWICTGAVARRHRIGQEWTGVTRHRDCVLCVHCVWST